MQTLTKSSIGETSTPVPAKGKILLLIDWDNLFISLYNSFKEQINLEHRIKKLLQWMKDELGELFEGHGFVFAPEHLSLLHQQMCVANNLRLMTCPKKRVQKADGKTEEADTVDETLIWFGKIMLRHPDVKIICLVSGDDDYVPLMEEAAKRNIKRALVAPTINSLSKSKNLLRMVDSHPATFKKMFLRLDALP